MPATGWMLRNLYGGWLNKGNIVLLDRYTYSNIAYQCAKISAILEQEKLMNWIMDLEFSHFSIPKPDLNIFLDVPFSFTEKKLSASRTGEDRRYLNGTRDIHEESLSFQKRVREIYLKVSRIDEKLCVVNCSDEKGEMLLPEKIFDLIIEIISARNLL